MSIDVNELIQRSNKIITEIEYRNRKQYEEAQAMVDAIARISDSNIEILKNEVPDILEIRKFTAEQLLENKNNERERACRVYSGLLQSLDRMVKFFEDALC